MMDMAHSNGRQDEALAMLRLIRSRKVGPVTYHRLVEEHGSAVAALDALPGIARAAGVDAYSVCPIEVAKHEIAQARVAGARMVCFGDADYPLALMDLPDAPPILWVQGDVALLNRPAIALVGARNASSLGLRMARRLAESLAEAGFVVVSGLARGIDAEAHEASLSTGTIAVQAGGVDVIYPVENAELAGRIAAQGCRVSEQPMGTEPQARHFPLRNRIISGLARAVIVVEAAARSGSLITAKNALDQGREVFAVPGHPFDARAAGCNMLIRDGATLIRSVSDVIEALGGERPQRGGSPPAGLADRLQAQAMPIEKRHARPRAEHQQPDVSAQCEPTMLVLPGPQPATRPLVEIAALHSKILDRLGPSPLAEDQLIRDLAMPAAFVAPELLSLELDGRIQRQAGGLLSRIS
jgi:DNA processing protein